MSGTVLSAIIAGGISLIGLVLSVISSVFIAGTRWGEVKSEITVLKTGQEHAATKEELAAVKESIAEIKGMFRLTLRRDD